MPRPPDFTPEMEATAPAELADYRATGEIPDHWFDWPPAVEAFRCGVWLTEKLVALGCSQPERVRICFANGQKMAMSADPWVPTLQTLEDYRTGKRMDEPGPTLADRLWRQFQERHQP